MSVSVVINPLSDVQTLVWSMMCFLTASLLLHCGPLAKSRQNDPSCRCFQQLQWHLMFHKSIAWCPSSRMMMMNEKMLLFAAPSLSNHRGEIHSTSPGAISYFQKYPKMHHNVPQPQNHHSVHCNRYTPTLTRARIRHLKAFGGMLAIINSFRSRWGRLKCNISSQNQ